MIGDVVGRGGRTTVKNILPDLINEYQIDFVTLQGENMASGFGLTLETVSREITKLKTSNVIKVMNSKQIYISDVDKLKSLCA